MEKNQPVLVDLRKESLRILSVLALVLVALTGLLSVFVGSDASNLYQDGTRIATAGGALGLSIAVVAKQGVRGLFGRSYLALAIGLACTFAAESVWGYYEIVLEEESPFPSVADALWLAAYGGIGYFLYSLSKFYGGGLRKWKVMLVAAIILALASFYIYSLASISLEYLEDDVTPLVISVAYPVLDAIVLVPAILMVVNSGKGKLTYVPWIFVGLVFLGIADTLLGFAALTEFQDDTTFITMMYNVSYVWMAAGMFWHARFALSGMSMNFK